MCLEGQLCAELELEGIKDVAGRAKAQHWIGWQAEVCASIQGVQVFDVGAIEQVEHIAA